MRRRFSAREWILLGLLAALTLTAAYVLLYYTPMTREREGLISAADAKEDELTAYRLRLAEKQRMERELEEIFENDPEPLSIAPYDNRQKVMFELNNVLAAADGYSLSFETVDTDEPVVRRSISINFTCGSYEAAKDILRDLHASRYRCMLDALSIVMDSGGGSLWGNSGGQDGVSVNATVVYFEYQ